MNAWVAVTVLAIAWFTYRLVIEYRRQEYDEAMAENLELRESNAKLALKLAGARQREAERSIDAYMTGFLEGVAAEKERHQ